MKPFETPLCKKAYDFGTDKCPQRAHGYTPVYYRMFNDKRETIKKVLEIGIGYEWKRNMDHYQWAASLRLWRDFFPNAHIYGIDIKPEVIKQDDRISTYLCDATDEQQLQNLIKTIGSDIDIVIDDGCHHTDCQIKTASLLMPLLQKDVVYLIEDVAMNRKIKRGLSEYDVVNMDNEPMPRKHPKRVSRDKLLWIKRRT